MKKTITEQLTSRIINELLQEKAAGPLDPGTRYPGPGQYYGLPIDSDGNWDPSFWPGQYTSPHPTSPWPGDLFVPRKDPEYGPGIIPERKPPHKKPKPKPNDKEQKRIDNEYNRLMAQLANCKNYTCRINVWNRINQLLDGGRKDPLRWPMPPYPERDE